MSFFKDLFPKKTLIKKENENNSSPPLTDGEYEFLFNQLLDGLAAGWQPARLVKFFEQLENRATPEDWIAWLNRFSQRMMSSPTSHRQLASRMLRLGEMTQSHASIREIGSIAAEWGKKLLMKGLTLPIWEYAGPDILPTPSAPPEPPEPEQLSHSPESVSEEIAPPTPESDTTEPESLEETPSETPPTETTQEVITLADLLGRLQQDANLVQHLARQLAIETDDPQVVFETIVHNLNAAQATAESQKKIPAPVEAWFNRGLEQAQAGDFEEAITSWDKALELNPNLPQAWHNRGSALAELGRMEEAIASFDQVIALNGNDYQAWNNKGNALYNLQQWEQALACWQRVVQIQPDYYQAWYNQACALENLGNLTDAIECYDQALTIQPQFQLAQTRRNSLQQKLGTDTP